MSCPTRRIRRSASIRTRAALVSSRLRLPRRALKLGENTQAGSRQAFNRLRRSSNPTPSRREAGISHARIPRESIIQRLQKPRRLNGDGFPGSLTQFTSLLTSRINGMQRARFPRSRSDERLSSVVENSEQQTPGPSGLCGARCHRTVPPSHQRRAPWNSLARGLLLTATLTTLGYAVFG